MPRPDKPAGPFRCFDASPEMIRLVIVMYVRLPLGSRNVKDVLFERGINICHKTVRMWWNRFGPMFASDQEDEIPEGHVTNKRYEVPRLKNVLKRLDALCG